MITSFRRFGGKTVFTLALACAALVASVSAASAAPVTYCVDPVAMPADLCPAGGIQQTSIASAITAASVNPGTDTILIDSGNYTTSTGWAAGVGNDVHITGVGATRPHLACTCGAGTTTLAIATASSQISNLAVAVPPASGATGISSAAGGGKILDVDVTGAGSTDSVGIEVDGNGSQVRRANIDMPNDSAQSIGLRGQQASSLAATDINVTHATTCIDLNTQSYNVALERIRTSCVHGILLTDSHGSISSSLLQSPSGAAPNFGTRYGIKLSNTEGVDHSVAADSTDVFNDTIIGNPGEGSYGVDAETVGAASKSLVNVDSSIVYGHDVAFNLNAGLGTINFIVDWSQYTGATSGASLGAHAAAAGDPQFVNAAGGDFSLQKSSPLVDAGDPGALGGSATDLAGNPRVASRGAGNIRDIGAYELSNGVPVAVISITTPTPVTTSPIAFSGSGSSDPDADALSFAWKFDNGQFSNGENVLRTLSTAGPHVVTLTVTDSTGAAATTSLQFTVDKGLLKLTLNKKPLRATGKGSFSVKLACPDQASSNCNGKLLFQTTDKKPLKAASYVYSVEPGTTRSLPITTTKSFRKLLKKKKKVVLRMSLSGTTGNAALTATATQFSLSVPKK